MPPSATAYVGETLIPVAHGHLEALYRPRADDAEKIALLLHPHPQHGGTMHNKVVFRAARALEDLGFETLRFNYRGVGKSSGKYGDGHGESEDAAAALAFLRSRQPAARHSLVFGFSFGAGVAFRLAKSVAGIDRILAVGAPAYALHDDDAELAASRARFIHGADDKIAPLGALTQRLRDLGIAPPLEVVTGADHFFTGHLDELRQAVQRAAR